MKKKTVYAALAAAIAMGISVPCFAANADNTKDLSFLKSKGTLKYQSDAGTVELYASDITLLADKIFTMPENAFEPAFYTHVHVWEYTNINELTHTKQCEECGYDITNGHKAGLQENTTISYEGSTYAGILSTCECGYQWTKERYHNYEYAQYDDTKHMVSCALDGTEYCSGFQAYAEEHVFDGILADDDNQHHTLTCISCGYEKTEECDYTAYYVIDEDAGEIAWYCQCGNMITEPYTSDTEQDTVSENDLDDAGADTEQDAVSENDLDTDETTYNPNERE